MPESGAITFRMYIDVKSIKPSLDGGVEDKTRDEHSHGKIARACEAYACSRKRFSQQANPQFVEKGTGSSVEPMPNGPSFHPFQEPLRPLHENLPTKVAPQAEGPCPTHL